MQQSLEGRGFQTWYRLPPRYRLGAVAGRWGAGLDCGPGRGKEIVEVGVLAEPFLEFATELGGFHRATADPASTASRSGRFAPLLERVLGSDLPPGRPWLDRSSGFSRFAISSRGWLHEFVPAVDASRGS